MRYSGDTRGSLDLTQTARVKGTAWAQEAQWITGNTVDLSSSTSHGSALHRAEDDDGTQWEWEPDTYTNAIFDLRKNNPPACDPDGVQSGALPPVWCNVVSTRQAPGRSRHMNRLFDAYPL